MTNVRIRSLRALLLPVRVSNLPLHYAKLALGRDRKTVPYDAKRFFDSFYGASEGALDDGYTISPESPLTEAKFHYNAVENSIIVALTKCGVTPSPRVLDIGSGSGHWIDFYRTYYAAAAVQSVEIAEPAAEFLRRKYSDDPSVAVACADIADPGFRLDHEFDVINAVGVLFHIVQDDQWRQAVRNLAGCLAPGGRMVVGGHFGFVDQNVQFHPTDDFASWDEYNASSAPRVLVDKRLRSLRTWMAVAAEAGLVVSLLQITKRSRAVYAPENNILVLSRR